MSISRLSALCIVELSLSYVVRSLSNNPKDELRLFNFCVKFSTLASVLFNLVIIALTSNCVLAFVRRGGCGVAGKGVAVVEDGLQRVVRGQAGQPGLVESQIGRQTGRQRLPAGREQLFFL